MKIDEFLKRKGEQENVVTVLEESLETTQKLFEREKRKLYEMLELAYKENLFQISYNDLLKEICQQIGVKEEKLDVNVGINFKIWHKRDKKFVEDYIRNKADSLDTALTCEIKKDNKTICEFNSKFDIDAKLLDGSRLWDHVKEEIKYNDLYNEYNTVLNLDKTCYRNLMFNIHPIELEISTNKNYLKPALIKYVQRKENKLNLN